LVRDRQQGINDALLWLETGRQQRKYRASLVRDMQQGINDALLWLETDRQQRK
jgi:hypothetical protein